MATLETEPGSPDETRLSLTMLNLNAIADPHTATDEQPTAAAAAAAAGSTSQEAVLPNDLIAEILSYLNVKTLMQFKTVSKSWKTLISNPTFINLHLQRSHRNIHLSIDWTHIVRDENFTFYSRVLSLFPVHRLIENLPIIVDYDTFCNSVELQKDYSGSYDSYQGDYNFIVGSYNGLVCFYSRQVIGDHSFDSYSQYWLTFRNLAMGTISEKLGQFLDSRTFYCSSFKFSFGYDNSNGTYKVVAFRAFCEDHNSPSWTSEVKIFNLGDNSWRNIQSFPVLPLSFRYGHVEPSNAVHLIGTVNWLALTNISRSSFDHMDTTYVLPHINAENLVILSLSLSTETYTQLLLPKDFNEVLHVRPSLRVLRNSLCFSHDFRGTEFVIWQMREFGVQESWTQLIRVSYQTLQMQNLPMGDDMYGIQLQPLYENSDVLIFAKRDERFGQAIIYYQKDDRVERTRSSEEICWFSTIDYVESLVPIA